MPAIDPIITAFFLGEDLDQWQSDVLRAEITAGRLSERDALAAALTIRDPRPIPDSVLRALEAVLARERLERGEVDAESLPTLADEGWADPSLPVERLSLWRGDLTRLRAGAIVNAANSAMLGCFVPGHACIDNAIHAAAGPRLRAECASHIAQQGHAEPTGTAAVTEGYELPARKVIHTVGPIVRGSVTDMDEELLHASYASILDAAERDPLIDSIGLCSVSTGVFGYPKPEAATVALAAIARWYAAHPGSRLRVVISLFADEDELVYRAALKERVE